MTDDTLVKELLQQILTKVEILSAHIGAVQIEQANVRGEFSTKVLEQSNMFDAKLLAMERRFDDKMTARSEKVDKWFDDMQEAFNHYQTTMEGRITSVSVKVGAISGGITLVVGAIVAIIVRYLTIQSHQ
jgi:hypothetical protein